MDVWDDEFITSMDPLDAYYIQLLHVGLPALRNATLGSVPGFATALAEVLHNIPSLIKESNPHRHSYFWHGERASYLEWAATTLSDDARFCTRRLQSVWSEMEPVILARIGEAESK
jgi:hypothetical protein